MKKSVRRFSIGLLCLVMIYLFTGVTLNAQDFKAFSTPGEVEWVVLYDWNENDGRHLKRIQADFNRKGLISEQGVKKQAFHILQDYYSSIEF
jgi:hypothetical protein